MNNEEINLDGIDLSTIPHAPSLENIINRIDYPIELFNIKTGQTKTLNLSLLILDHNKYYGFSIIYCTDDGFSYQAITSNAYATYQEFRQPHEAQGWRFKSKGARINAQVSGMLVSYGGTHAYLIDKQTLKSDGSNSVDIFAHDEDISEHDTVIAQKAFHKTMWRETVESARESGIDEDLLNYVMGK